MLMNEAMCTFLSKISLKDISSKKLNHELKSIIDNGFFIKDDCALLKKFERLNRGELCSFDDEVEFECSFNSIHIDDFAKGDFFIYAIIYAYELTLKWKINFPDRKIKLILSLDDENYSPTVTFYTDRGKDYLNENKLNSYINPILIISGTFSYLDLVCQNKNKE
ncbi:hypothetical protein [Conservatibacter flavescens]|uniref:Uncharacterized protein n=1 Tax=Conservatibacter flavescens TaxID=28161 RepID=A0A2M8S494_9PAST|nr:hypothetical protein [Conservatibacter flavescens]PJG85960.1 hypothetical protein CVP05_03590 [Conservatibacter flavescens]